MSELSQLREPAGAASRALKELGQGVSATGQSVRSPFRGSPAHVRVRGDWRKGLKYICGEVMSL